MIDENEKYSLIFLQLWALVVICIGGIGNGFSLIAITYQLIFKNTETRSRNAFIQKNVSKAKEDPKIYENSKFSKNSIKEYKENEKRLKVIIDGDLILLIHLSFCDFIYCIIVLPMVVKNYNMAVDGKTLSEEMCIVFAYTKYVIAITEFYTLAILSLERCVDLRRAGSNKIFTVKRSITICVLIWITNSCLQLGGVMKVGLILFFKF